MAVGAGLIVAARRRAVRIRLGRIDQDLDVSTHEHGAEAEALRGGVGGCRRAWRAVIDR
jgi:hypothetical protein